MCCEGVCVRGVLPWVSSVAGARRPTACQSGPLPTRCPSPEHRAAPHPALRHPPGMLDSPQFWMRRVRMSVEFAASRSGMVYSVTPGIPKVLPWEPVAMASTSYCTKNLSPSCVLLHSTSRSWVCTASHSASWRMDGR